MKAGTDDDDLYLHRRHARNAIHGSGNRVGILEVIRRHYKKERGDSAERRSTRGLVCLLNFGPGGSRFLH